MVIEWDGRQTVENQCEATNRNSPTARRVCFVEGSQQFITLARQGFAQLGNNAVSVRVGELQVNETENKGKNQTIQSINDSSQRDKASHWCSEQNTNKTRTKHEQNTNNPYVVLFHPQQGVLIGINENKLEFVDFNAGANEKVLGREVAAAVRHFVLALLQEFAWE